MTTSRRDFLIGVAAASVAAACPALANDGVTLGSMAHPVTKWSSSLYHPRPDGPHVVESYPHQHWVWYGTWE